MRYRQPLDGLLFSQTATRLLRELTRHPEKAYTGRELAEAAGVPHHRAGEALQRLQLEGVVTSRVVGRAYLWQLRPLNVVTRAVREMFKAEAAFHAELMLTVRKHLGKELGIDRVTLFGSAARGDERPGSDLDLLVVISRATERRALERALVKLAADLREGYGVRLAPIVYTRAEFDRRRSLPLMKAISAEGITMDLREEWT